VTRENVLRLVRDHLGKAGPDDAVLVYITSHGGFDKTPGKGSFLSFAGDPDHPLLRNELVAEVDKLNVRLKVIVDESCNNFQRVQTAVAPTYEAPAAQPPYSPLFWSLFVESRGRLVLASSAPGEFSIIPPPADWNNKDERRPSLFTNCLVGELANSERTATWPEVVDRVKSEVDRRFRLLFPPPEGFVSPDFPFLPPQMTQTVTVDGGFPDPAPRPGGPSRDRTRLFGFDVIYPNPFGGLVVNRVFPGSAAEQAGRLERGDIITAINGKTVSTQADWVAAVGQAGPGGRVFVEGIDVRTGKGLEPFFAGLPAAGPLAGNLGVNVEANEHKGLRIGATRQDSFAAFLKLEPGDVIAEVNDQEVVNGQGVPTVDRLEEVLRGVATGQVAVFQGFNVRNNQPFSIKNVVPDLD